MSCVYTRVSTRLRVRTQDTEMKKLHTSGEGVAEKSAPVSQCSCNRLRRTARHISRRYDSALKETGLKISQYSILANVARSSGMSITDLANKIVLDRTTLTRNLKPLEKSGYISIVAGADARSRAVEITASGQALYERARPLWRDAEVAFREELGAIEANSLYELLDKVLAVR